MSRNIAQEYMDALELSSIFFDWSALKPGESMETCLDQLRACTLKRKRNVSDDSGCSSPRRLCFDGSDTETEDFEDTVAPLSEIDV